MGLLDSQTALDNTREPDESDITVRILNFLSAIGRNLNLDNYLEFELRRLIMHEKILCQTGYFYGRNFGKALGELELLPPGSFLIRYSSDPKCLYTLSISGIFSLTQMRICYKKGWFTIFDNFEQFMNLTTGFETVMDLVEHFRRHPPFGPQLRPMWRLVKPHLHKVPSLKHLCLRSVSRVLKQTPATISLLGMKNLGLSEDLQEEVKENAFPLETIRDRMIAEVMRSS